jgi:uncharacterized protein (DUF362 family)
MNFLNSRAILTTIFMKKTKEMKKQIASWMFYFFGISSLVWFLIRVIPKPSRAAYPCMRAAAPVASSFVLYLVGLAASVTLFRKTKKLIAESRYLLGSVVLLVGITVGIITMIPGNKRAYALSSIEDNIPNEPMGDAKGVIPGRVAWVHNPDATNEMYAPFVNNYWMDDQNTNREAVDKMVSNALQTMTGTDSDENAWHEIFRYHNLHHGKGDVGYTKGEKIVIKVNLNSNRSKYGSGKYVRSYPQNIDTSPQVILAMLDQLVNKAGAEQEDISVGDPGRNYDDMYYDICTEEFPDVHYWGEGNGRTPVVKTTEKILVASDGGTEDWLPQCYVDAAYMINMPVFKKHHRAGISLACKNHFGDFVAFSGTAAHWHYSLPAANGGGDVINPGYGLYRCQVDIMGHEDLGDKTVLYLFDALWSSTNNANPPIKWGMAPFNNDFPSSLFASMDPVAIESVGFDFLYAEFGPDHPTEGAYDPQDVKGPFPHYSGVDDYLHQAADSLNWPEGVVYDPENDGTPLPGSMGVHEHWNNATDKEYSRNLGTGNGIELVYVQSTTGTTSLGELTEQQYRLEQNHPNPFNTSTTVEFTLSESNQVQLSVFDISGRLVTTLVDADFPAGTHSATWDGTSSNGQPAASGLYIYRMKTGSHVESKRMRLERW